MRSFHDIMTGLAGPTTFYFVRHGESEGNVAGKMQGHLDHPLTDLGRDQARATGEWFAAADVAVQRVFASPLKRAFETAAILAAALWFTYRYFTEVWPNREKVYVPEPWKGD